MDRGGRKDSKRTFSLEEHVEKKIYQINHSLIQTNCMWKKNPPFSHIPSRSSFFLPPFPHFASFQPMPSFPPPSKSYISRRHCHIVCLWHRLPGGPLARRERECNRASADNKFFRTEKLVLTKELHPLLSATLSRSISSIFLFRRPGCERASSAMAASAEPGMDVR